MDIAVAADNNYVAHLATLICSICENNKKSITIHILDSGIKSENIDKIYSLKKIYLNLEIARYNLIEKELKEMLGIEVKKDRSLSAYARIFIPNLVSEDINRILYLDVDGIVCGSLEDLFEIDMEGFPIAGVLDTITPPYRTGIGMSLEDNYINSGLILWDLKKCREIGIVDKFKKFIHEKNGEVIGMDQGTINGTLNNNVLILDPSWNVITPFFQLTVGQLKKSYQLKNYYTQEKINNSIINPKFIHFTPHFTSRPWQKGCKHPWQKQYLYYRNKTKFRLSNLEQDNRKLQVIILGKLFYFIPFSLFSILMHSIRKTQKLSLFLKKL